MSYFYLLYYIILYYTKLHEYMIHVHDHEIIVRTCINCTYKYFSLSKGPFIKIRTGE